jgi:hypothetical protein
MAQPVKKTRGRSSITHIDKANPTRPPVQVVERVDADRPIGSGTGKHRGDRRDTNRYYTGNQKHAARGSNPRKDVSTRKR